jgi:hypothetical protein
MILPIIYAYYFYSLPLLNIVLTYAYCVAVFASLSMAWIVAAAECSRMRLVARRGE